MPIVVVQKWEESERGWGTRPDGYSIHRHEYNRQSYISDYWNKMPRDEVPDEYERPCGTPYEAEVSDTEYEEVCASKFGVRRYNNNYPGSGGIDGWLPSDRVERGA